MEVEHRQVVSQHQFHMTWGGLKYGFIITNKELVMFRRGTGFWSMEQGRLWNGMVPRVVLEIWGLIHMAKAGMVSVGRKWKAAMRREDGNERGGGGW